ncbi:MAG: short-chain dehydrogenase [Frankiales bacterium]|jgi:NAD(P)-dependent dehydrogenase (short-subunit alcohol dehydrogenase family)|nr:short-chain dehydrogenase [Frankiales bacterium]
MSRRSARPLPGQVVVVTGAARGLGAELARQLTDRGARVALLGLEPEELERVRESLPGSACWAVDVTDGAALGVVAEQVVAHFGRVDALVVNAGIGAGGSLLHAEPASYDLVVEVNLLGSIRTVRAFLPALVSSRGYVLQVASLAALLPVPLMSAYCASKSGVEAFARSLRVELSSHGVDVGVGYLSWTDTDMVRGADATPGLGEFRAQLPGPFGRTYPLTPTVARLAVGVEQRAASVYCQPWLRAVTWVRGSLPAIVARTQGARAAAAEQALVRGGALASRPVGAGGAAAHRPRPD